MRNEVFTRRGGAVLRHCDPARLPGPLQQALYRFADFNAGRYSSRNAAFQAPVARLAGQSSTLDGDLLRYKDGQPRRRAPARPWRPCWRSPAALGLPAPRSSRDLRLEKTAAFAQIAALPGSSPWPTAAAGQPAPRELPRIDLNSPKIQRKLTTAWFAERVDARYRTCLGARPSSA